MKILFLALGVLFLSPFARASYFADSVDRATSISTAYDSRSIFANPAALGFQTELDGAQLLSNFTYGLQSNQNDEFAFGLTYGYLGFGVDQVAIPASTFTRYGFGLGIPITPYLYWGGRYRFTRSDSPTFDRLNTIDLGLQFRPLNALSFGFLVNNVNNPSQGSSSLPIQYTLGATVRPFRSAEASADLITTSQSFATQFGYQFIASYQVMPGLKLRGGYNSEYQWQAGIQIDLGHASLYSVVQPLSGAQGGVLGAQFSTLPYDSLIRVPSAIKTSIEGNLSEEPTSGGFFSRPRPSLLELLQLLDKARTDDRVKLVILKIDDFPLGLAAAQDVYESIWALRKAGIQVEAFLGNSGLKEYLIASAANKIHMEPTAELRLMGLHSERYFIKGTLDKVGIEGEFLAKGEYKSAPEMFTRKESSPQSREETLQILKTAEAEIVPLIARGRTGFADKWKKIIQTALFSADQAKAEGVIDEVDHYVESSKKLTHSLCTHESLDTKEDRLALKSRVAVIVASGDILEHRVQALSLGGREQITPEKMEARFKEAVSDPLTKALVFRVSSGGGEILPSDQIAAMVENARHVKPVIVSMGDLAASGGYFISAPANRIFAQPLTLTGSIGVFLGKASLAGLYGKIDLHKEILSYAPYPGLFSEDRPWTPEERAVLQRRLDQYYDSFVSFVASHRSLSKEDAEKSAKGRVWLGSAAKERKLVDELGGYLAATRFAAEEADLGDDYELWLLQESRGLFDFFGSGEGFIKADGGSLIPRGLISEEILKQLRWMDSLRKSPFLYLSPISTIE
jgi:protease IV